MKFIVQNVLNASAIINNKIYSSINKGYLILVGYTNGDNINIINKMIDKVINMRVFSDQNYKTNLSILDVDGDILLVSQFTLYANFKEGRRPSFNDAIKFDEGKKLYDLTIELFNKKFNKTIKTGIFGADMKISLINDGPFTSILDSKEILK